MAVASRLQRFRQPTTASALHLVVAALLLWLPDPAYGEDPEWVDPDWVELPTTPDAYHEDWLPGERDGYKGWLLDQRTAWVHRVNRLGRNLDGFFASRDAYWDSNESYMILSGHTVIGKKGEIEFDPRLRVRLDLPYTKEKFRLILESDAEEDLSLAERARERSLTAFERKRSTASGAVRYIFDELDRWQLSTDLGVRFRFPPDPFWRFQASRQWQLTEYWSTRFHQRLYWYLKDGLGESSELYFERPLSPTMLFRAKSEAEWSKDENQFDFGQIFSILHQIDTKRAAEWQLGALGESKPTTRTTDYFANVTYRRLLYKDWLFYELTPELLFPRDDSFKPNPSISIGIEIIFSE